MSGRGLLAVCALFLLGSGVPSAVAQSTAIVETVPPRPAKSTIPGDSLGAVHPDLEILADVALTRRTGALNGDSRGRSRIKGTAAELRSLFDRGLITDMRRIPQMWEAGIVSEGVIGSDVEVWHRAGWFGQGVKIGVLDSSFTGYSELLGTELPATVTTRSFDIDGLEQGDNRHGTAVAEIVYDVAPLAGMVLVNAGPGRFGEAVDYLIAQGVDIINLSAGWPVGPFDGSAQQDAIVNRAIDAGIVWVNAAGNEADRHFSGTYQDSNSDGWAELSGTVIIDDFTIPPGAEFELLLNWTGPVSDLDLCLWDLDRILSLPPAEQVPEDCSEAQQSLPWHQQLEVIEWINTSSEERWYGFSIAGDPLAPPSGTPYDVFADGVFDLSLQVPASSLLVPNATERVISVGAVPWFDLSVIEDFSSRGPTADGRVKPDLVAPDRVSTESFDDAFGGTSASSPYVAGLAALYLNLHPNSTPLEVRRELGIMADGLPAGSGKNSTFGWGLARLRDPPRVRDSIGYQIPSNARWTVRDFDETSETFIYGIPGDQRLMCDWNGDGIDTPGLYRPSSGFMYLRNSNDSGVADLEFFFGNPGDVPVCGDWDGDGDDTPGIYRPTQGKFYLRNTNDTGFADIEFHFGLTGDVPFAGDWNGDGIDTVGLYRPWNSLVLITNENTTKVADSQVFYGITGDRFFVGDWDGDGVDSFGIFRPSDRTFYLSNDLGGVADEVVPFGVNQSRPIAGFFG
jgi:subtilisin family serine protease